MQPLIRIDSYVNEYTDLIYNQYASTQNVYFVNYYRLDKEASIYDEHYKDSYEDVGDLSGIKWNKILNIPIFLADPVIPSMDFSETGLNIHDSTNSTAIISPDVDLIPRTGDIFYTNINNDVSMFNVTGVSFTGNRDLDNTYTKITFSNRHASIEKVDKQVNGVYFYLEPLHKIYPIDVAEWLLTIINSMITHRRFINNYFNNHLNAFVINPSNKSEITIDYELNYYYMKLLSQDLPTVVTSMYQYDLSLDNFSNNDKSLLKLLFDETFNKASYLKTYEEKRDDVFINPFRKQLYISVKLFGLGNTDPLDTYLNLYNYSSTDKANVYTALNILKDYRNGNSINYKDIPNSPNLSRMIKFYLILKTVNNLDTLYPDMIKHLNENENLLDTVYGLYVMLEMFNNLKDRNKVFD